jgi:chromosome segregation ATPase
MKNSMLQAQLEQLQEVSTINRMTLEQLADDLESKDLECAELRKAARLLDAELKQAALSPGPDATAASSAELQALQEKLDFANDCRKTFKHSLREKEQEAVTLQETIEGRIAHGDNTADAVLRLQFRLDDAQDAIKDLQMTITSKDEQLSMLRSELHSTKSLHTELVKARDDLSQQNNAQQEQLTSLRTENDIIATRAAAAESTMGKYKSHISTFTQQFQALATVSASSQTKYQGQIDAMYAQQRLAEQQSAAKLQAKDALIAELQQSLKHAQQAKAIAAQYREDEFARLKDQVCRLTLSLADEEIKAKVWQQFANEQSAKVEQLQAITA